jgi:hypothetical protein
MVAEPLTALADCLAGHHCWLEAALVGRAFCTICGVWGYYRSCPQIDIPPGTPVRSCRLHRHAGLRLHDSRRPFSATRRIVP